MIYILNNELFHDIIVTYNSVVNIAELKKTLN